jgi:hypothetical protein
VWKKTKIKVSLSSRHFSSQHIQCFSLAENTAGWVCPPYPNKTMSSTTNSAKKSRPLSEIIRNAAAKAIGGGLPGAAAMVIQVRNDVNMFSYEYYHLVFTVLKRKIFSLLLFFFLQGVGLDVDAHHRQLSTLSWHQHIRGFCDFVCAGWNCSFLSRRLGCSIAGTIIQVILLCSG